MRTTDRQSHRGSSRGGTGASALYSASSLLRDLLTRKGAYRRRWRAEVRRASRNDPHQSAVAMVLAQHLWEIGEVPEADTDLPRRLKDVVARAVGGGGISHQTLGWFVGAFEMTEDDERALWHQHEADLRAEGHTAGFVTQSTAPDAADTDSGLGPVSAQPHHRAPHTYRTQSLIEQFEIGGDRSRRRHALVHIVQAHQPLDRLSYRFDTPSVTVEVSRGGAATGLQPDLAPGLHTLDVIFPAPLAPGQTTVVEMTATYAPGGPPVHEFRRLLRATAGGVSLEVCFDPAAVPGRVRWVEWERVASGEQHAEDTPAPAGGVVHRFLTPDRDCVVGFEWDW